MHSIFVAADCNGAKINLEFEFDRAPSVAELLSRATEAFRQVFNERRLGRGFTASASVIFNDALSTWDRLERSTQLIHNSQVYLFQPDTLDVPAEIEDPIPAARYLAWYASPERPEASQPSPRPSAPSTYEPRSAFTNQSPQLYDAQFSYSAAARSSFETSPVFAGAGSNPYSLAQSSRYERRSTTSSEQGGSSILREERERLERQLALPLDAMREEVRQEARKFSVSPERH